jgi:hypothetical protein
VRVHSSDELAPGLPQADVQRVRNAPGEVVENPDRVVLGGELLEESTGAIVRASVHEQQLDRPSKRWLLIASSSVR